MTEPPSRRRWPLNIARWGIGLFIAVVVCPVTAGAAILSALVYAPLPGGKVPDPLPTKIAEPTIILDAHGAHIGTIRPFDQAIPIAQEDIPQVLVKALTSAEDRDFYSHGGVDPQAIVRALIADFQHKELVQGGSTLTQQYVKSAYVGDDVTLRRKLTEALIASRIETQLDKDEILRLYLERTFFGEGSYGAAAAADSYFRKPLRDLTLSESALLVGIIPAPTRYSPRDNPENAETKRKVVLNSMRETGAITQAEYDEAITQVLWQVEAGAAEGPVTLIQPPQRSDTSSFPYYQDYVRRWMAKNVDPAVLERGGLTVVTALDPRIQQAADAAVTATLKGTPEGVEMALASVDPRTGFVKAIVGGRDFNAVGGQVNLALGRAGGGSGRQLGSAFKPFVLAAALSQGKTLRSVYSGAPHVLPDRTTVQNYGGAVYGSLTLQEATKRSANTPFTRLIGELGIANTMERTEKLGVDLPDYEDGKYGVGVALGALDVAPLDVAAGYSVFAARGAQQAPTPVAVILDKDGRIVLDNRARQATLALDRDVADNVITALTGVLGPGGTASGRGLPGRVAAGKTGTTQNNRDAWFVGFTPQLSTSVWMGYRDTQEELRNIRGVRTVTGGTLPAATWRAFMLAAHEDMPVVSWTRPGAPDPVTVPGR